MKPITEYDFEKISEGREHTPEEMEEIHREMIEVRRITHHKREERREKQHQEHQYREREFERMVL